MRAAFLGGIAFRLSGPRSSRAARESSARPRSSRGHCATVTEHHDLSDTQWYAVEAWLPPMRSGRGRPWRHHRQVINGILWVLSTERPWRELPARYGPWETAYTRYKRWRDNGTWDRIQHLIKNGSPLDPEISPMPSPPEITSRASRGDTA